MRVDRDRRATYEQEDGGGIATRCRGSLWGRQTVRRPLAAGSRRELLLKLEWRAAAAVDQPKPGLAIAVDEKGAARTDVGVGESVALELIAEVVEIRTGAGPLGEPRRALASTRTRSLRPR
jgi:hypothetical protein